MLRCAPTTRTCSRLRLQVLLDLVEKRVRAVLVDAELVRKVVEELVLLVGDGVVGEGDRRREHESDLGPRGIRVEDGGDLRQACLSTLLGRVLARVFEERLDEVSAKAVVREISEGLAKDVPFVGRDLAV